MTERSSRKQNVNVMFDGKVSYAISSVTWLAIEFIQLALQRSVQEVAMKQEYAVINLHISLCAQPGCRARISLASIISILPCFEICVVAIFRRSLKWLSKQRGQAIIK
jgi:hypothetical protein